MIYKVSYETFIEDRADGSGYFCLTVYTGGEVMQIRFTDKDRDIARDVLRRLEVRLVRFLNRETDEFKTSDIPGLRYKLKDGAK
jgi:hypothetical protein